MLMIIGLTSNIKTDDNGSVYISNRKRENMDAEVWVDLIFIPELNDIVND